MAGPAAGILAALRSGQGQLVDVSMFDGSLAWLALVVFPVVTGIPAYISAFVVGWLASISGLALVLIGAFAPSALFLYFLGPTILTIGLIAGCGSQAIERRARGAAYAGPSPVHRHFTVPDPEPQR